jgi:hypothetical protein
VLARPNPKALPDLRVAEMPTMRMEGRGPALVEQSQGFEVAFRACLPFRNAGESKIGCASCENTALRDLSVSLDDDTGKP